MLKFKILILTSIFFILTLNIVNGETVISNVPIKINFPVQALTSSPTDSQTVYFGIQPRTPSTVASSCKQRININGNITGTYIYCYSGTAGTNENWVLYLRLNNLVDYVIATVGTATSERIWEKWDFNIKVVKGDYFEIKVVNPLWVTNPLTTIFGGYVEVTNLSKQTTEVTMIETIDYNVIFFILFLIVWLIMLYFSFIRKEKGFSYLQMGLMIPLVVYLVHNSFVNSFIFGYLFSFVFVVTSIYALAVNMIDLESKK